MKIPPLPLPLRRWVECVESPLKIKSQVNDKHRCALHWERTEKRREKKDGKRVRCQTLSHTRTHSTYRHHHHHHQPMCARIELALIGTWLIPLYVCVSAYDTRLTLRRRSGRREILWMCKSVCDMVVFIPVFVKNPNVHYLRWPLQSTIIPE